MMDDHLRVTVVANRPGRTAAARGNLWRLSRRR